VRVALSEVICVVRGGGKPAHPMRRSASDGLIHKTGLDNHFLIEVDLRSTSRELTRGHRVTPSDGRCDVCSSRSRTGESLAGATRGQCWLNYVERRAPATPSVRQPRPEHTIKRSQAKAWTAGTIRDNQLVPQREDLQVQRRA
jgi:hypothetical protein